MRNECVLIHKQKHFKCLRSLKSGDIIKRETGKNIVHAADEYYLVAGRPIPDTSDYDNFDMYEDGVGIVRTFEREFTGEVDEPTNTAAGFFAWVDGRPLKVTEPLGILEPNLVS